MKVTTAKCRSLPEGRVIAFSGGLRKKLFNRMDNSAVAYNLRHPAAAFAGLNVFKFNPVHFGSKSRRVVADAIGKEIGVAVEGVLDSQFPALVLQNALYLWPRKIGLSDGANREDELQKWMRWHLEIASRIQAALMFLSGTVVQQAMFCERTGFSTPYFDFVSTTEPAAGGIRPADFFEDPVNFGYELAFGAERGPGLEPRMPSLISVAAYMNNHQLPLFLMAVDDIVSELSDTSVEVLQQPLFQKKPWTSTECLRSLSVENVPVLAHTATGWEIAHHQNRTMMTSDRAGSEALQELFAVVDRLQTERHEYEVILRKGDVLLASNRRFLFRARREPHKMGEGVIRAHLHRLAPGANERHLRVMIGHPEPRCLAA